MRFRSLGLLAAGLLFACSTALPAASQPCGEAINGHEIAIGFGKSISTATVTLYDYTGTAMRATALSPLGAGQTTIQIPGATTAHPCNAFTA